MNSVSAAYRAALTLFLAAVALLAFSAGANAAFVFQIDEGGPNEPPDGQVDLTRAGVDSSTLPAALGVQWNWDETAQTGSNTSDGCSLFDTDGDDFVNYSVCVTVAGDPMTLSATRVYSCGDDKVDRCTQPVTEILPITTTCTVDQTATDPFVEGDEFPNDTTADCLIQLADIGGGPATLLNVCSYPSQQPNSNPFDCIYVPRDAFIVIEKVASPDDGTQFPFTLDGDPAFTATGSDTSDPIAVRSDITHSVAEQVPEGWSLDSATCGSENGNVTADGVSDVALEPGSTVTCTFHDSKLPAPPAIDLRKTASATEVVAGTVVTFTLQVENTGGVTLFNVNIADDKCIPLTGPAGDVGDDLQLAPGEIWTYTCSMAINSDTTNVATVSAIDDREQTVSDQDTATVRVAAEQIAQALPALSVRLAKANACVSRVFRLNVVASGGTVRSAKLYIDGRLKATRKSGKFTIDGSKYRPGRHRIRVVTTFSDGRVVTRTGSFERCAVRARVSPQFTG